MRFQSETSVFKFLLCSMYGPQITHLAFINNCNRPEWSSIRSVMIMRVIDKLNRTNAKRNSDLLITSMIKD